LVTTAKALELFMIQLVTKSADEARDRSSKRVTAAHLKNAVMKDQMFDFLEEIISKVQDPTAKKDENGDEGDGKKKKGGGVRRKKTDSDDF
jgi:Dr1-associated corepressor